MSILNAVVLLISLKVIPEVPVVVGKDLVEHQAKEVAEIAYSREENQAYAAAFQRLIVASFDYQDQAKNEDNRNCCEQDHYR